MKQFILRIVNKIHRLLLLPYRLIKRTKLGISFNKWYNNTKESSIFICVNGIGDVVWFMAYWNQYKRINSISDNYTIMANKRLKELLSFYGELNLTDYYDEYSSYIFNLWEKNKLYKYPKIHVMAFPKDQCKKKKLVENDYKAAVGITMDDCYKFGCFDLSYENDEPITKPRLATTKYTIETKKNILLIPYTNSRINIPLSIWSAIAKELMEYGFTVYTNIGTPNEKNVEGTIPFSIKITELPAVLLKYNFISVCGRCGLADWLFVNECKQIIIHSCMKNPKNKTEFLRSQLERKDSFKMMKKKCSLNENVADDVWLYIDNLENDYTKNILKKVINMDKI